MGEWISGQKIMDDNDDIARPDIFNIVTEEDLQPYYESGRRKPSPEFSENLSELEELNKQLPILKQRIERAEDPKGIRQELIRARQELAGKDDETELQYAQARKKEIEGELPQPNPYSWKDYRLPDSEKEVAEIIDDLINSYFKAADVDRLLKVELTENNSDQELVNAKMVDEQEAAFVLDGDTWEINFRGNKTKLYNFERIRYIAYLLEYPNEDFYANELYRLVKGQSNEVNKNYNTMSEEQLDKEGLSLTGLKIESLSKEEKDRLENSAYDVWEQLKEAERKGNQDKIEKLKMDWSKTINFLDRDYGVQVIEKSKGLFFKLRIRSNKETEKYRQKVATQINNAIKEFKKHIPSLSTYLKNHINTGGTCKYTPDPDKPVKWTVQWPK